MSSAEQEMKVKRKRCLEAATRRVTGETVNADREGAEVEVVAVSQAKKQRPMWECPHCTFRNDSEPNTVCAMCRRANTDTEDSRNDTEQQWTCDNCTLINNLSSMKCVACTNPKPGTASSVQAVLPRVTGPPPTLDRIRIVTLNVSEFQNSFSAPVGFDQMEAFSEELLRDNPDIICLQEAPNADDSLFEMLFPGYECLGRADSHSAFVMLFVKSSWVAHATLIPIHFGDCSRAVVARVTFADNVSVVIGSCHLKPFNIGADGRLSKMKEILSHCRPHDKLLIAGDYNMRQAEDSVFEALGLLDAWKEAGSDMEKKFTWNSFRNKYRANGFANRARYDRIYLRGLAVDDFRMCANVPLSDNPGHFLSDHFGLRAVVRIGNGEDSLRDCQGR